ncbi:MAG: hypothetical protein L6U16_09845 [Porphyromonadaceae bacterium]|nr:MAG: hypothetical protein L6U16_09845 [Porphyromonadaceae bacterium]
MKGKDIEMRSNRKVSLTSEHSESWFSEATAIDYGMIVLCREGEATIGVNFLEWRLKKGSVITLFPNDVVAVTNRTDDFGVEILKYGASLLREASLQLEQTVYSQLKTDRCRTESPILTNIINNMFAAAPTVFQARGLHLPGATGDTTTQSLFPRLLRLPLPQPRRKEGRNWQPTNPRTVQPLHEGTGEPLP